MFDTVNFCQTNPHCAKWSLHMVPPAAPGGECGVTVAGMHKNINMHDSLHYSGASWLMRKKCGPQALAEAKISVHK